MTERPFVHEHVVKWGECDPAGIVYTPQVLHYVIEALEVWQRAVLDTHWLDNIRKRGIGSPMVATALWFRRPMAPETRLHIAVHVQRVGGSSLDLGFVGRDSEDIVRFVARVASTFVDRDHRTPIPIPDDLRARAEAYHAAVGPSPEDLPPLR